MSTNTAPTQEGIGVTRDEFNQLQSRVSTLEDEKEELQEELENEREARKELETLVGALRNKSNHHDEQLDECQEDIEELEAEEDLPDSGGMDGEEGEVAASQIAQTPLERTTVLPKEICDYVNDKRARHLAMDLKQYARKGKSGYLLEPSDIADVLYSREKSPAAAHDNTVSRVREILAEQGGEEVQVVETGRKKVVHFTEEIVKRLRNLAKLRDRCPSLVCEEDSRGGVRDGRKHA